MNLNFLNKIVKKYSAIGMFKQRQLIVVAKHYCTSFFFLFFSKYCTQPFLIHLPAEKYDSYQFFFFLQVIIKQLNEIS